MPLSARLLIISFSFLIFTILPAPSFAQTNYVSQPTIADAQQESFKIQRILAGFGQVIICQLSGRDVFRPGYDCDGYKTDAVQGNNRQSSSGLLGMTLGGIGSMYQPPINTAASLSYFAGNFGIIKDVVAQDAPEGSFARFSFLQDMYLTIRNISFMLLVFVFIFIGMAIMLRFKIDPRTAMNIQNQLPKIIVGIVMITFSYSIAGLLADGMWVLTYFGINTIGNVAQVECGNYSNGNAISGVATKNLLNNPMAFARDIFSDGGCFGSFDGLSGLSRDVGLAMGGAISNTILEAVGLDATSANDCNPNWHHPDVTDCLQAGIYSFLSFIIGIIATIIVLAAIILALVRLWFTLIKAYIYILLDIVTAPIQIMLGILPGGKMGFGKWIRHISAYLLVFPASATLMVLAVAFALNKDLNHHSSDLNTTFYPPLIGIPGGSGNMGALIAFGLIMITPELLEMLKDALQVKNSDRATKAITGGFARGLAPTAALGGFGKELFGKDKNNSPRIGNTLMRGVGSKLGISGEGAKKSKYKGLAFRTFKRSQQAQVERKRELNKQDLNYQYQRAEDYGDIAYREHLRDNSTDYAGANMAKEQAQREYLQKTTSWNYQPKNSSSKGQQSAGAAPSSQNTQPSGPSGSSSATAAASPASQPPVAAPPPGFTTLRRSGNNLIEPTNGTIVATIDESDPTNLEFKTAEGTKDRTDFRTWLNSKKYFYNF